MVNDDIHLMNNSDVQLTCHVNGEYLVSFLSQDTTLLPGTVILTYVHSSSTMAMADARC
jgi:2-keto-4-pentenoate hydratase/2-oxohepta-3-ene-1,7-dioic acid hydratase in catechol pathway